MKILLLSSNSKKSGQAKMFGTENIIKVIFDEMNKSGISTQIIEPIINENSNVKKNKILENYFSRGKFTDPSNFKSLLREIRPDLVQFHGFTEQWGFSHLLACKEYSIKTLLWHNVPSITCMQHELLYMSKQPCDGKFSLEKCTACRLNMSIKNDFISTIFGNIGNFNLPYTFTKK